MARKKKTDENIEITSTENLGYRTKVKIDIVDKKGKVVKSYTTHNSAGTPLFTFLLNCLRGNYYPGDRPRYAIVVYDSTHKALYSTLDATVPSINENNITIEAGTPPSIIYKVLIPNVLIRGKTINGVALYSTNKVSQAVTGTAVSSSDYSMMVNFANKSFSSSDEYSIVLSWQVVITDQGYVQ